jgi:hypothetical protein
MEIIAIDTWPSPCIGAFAILLALIFISVLVAESK